MKALRTFLLFSCSAFALGMDETTVQPSSSDGTEEPTCEEVGFHRHPSDCAKFFRCVDFKYPTGALTIFHFDCPQGTIFDEVLSVCNWPEQAQPPCPEPEPVPEPEPEPETTTMAVEEAEETTPMPGPDLSGEEEETDTIDQEYEEEDSGDTVIISPTFSFKCEAAGIFPHSNDCAKFWLCKKSKDSGNLKPAELYKCPGGFLFQDDALRCQKEDKVVCDKTPVLNRFATNEPLAITLQVSELDGFFARWGKS